MKVGFDGVNGSSNARPQMEAWKIHDVIFKGVEYGSFAGKKDPNTTWQVMRTKFESKDGKVFEETTFCPKDGDEVRQKTGDRENPSNLERFQFYIAQLGEQLAPERYAKFKGRQYELPKDFEKMIRDLGEVLKPAVGKPTKLKLIGNKKGEATLPYFVNLNRDGQAYASNNFVGDKVFFSNYELEAMKKRQEATPTDMGTVSDEINTGEDVSESVDNDDLNFEV
jgi:hypothetical protein